MRRMLVLFVMVCAAATAAQAQTPADTRGYAEAVAQSAFGNVTSQSYGAEIGIALRPGLQIFVEGGQVRNAATADIQTGADKMVRALNDLQTATVGATVKQPVAFGVAGLRYVFPVSSPRIEPYILGGFGVARVKNDVTFQLGGAEASASTISQYITLGTDLLGKETRPMASGGVGVAWTAWKQLVLDFQYRYGRVFVPDQGVNVNRAGIGVGVRF